MTHKKIGQFFKTGIDKFSISVAPLAIFLVECAVGLFADGRVIKGHTAALADQFSGHNALCGVVCVVATFGCALDMGILTNEKNLYF